MIQRLLQNILFCAIIFVFFSTVGYAQGDNVDMLGSGTEQDPYQITTREHLNMVFDEPTAHYTLMNDIEFLSSDFEEGGAFYEYGIKPTPGYSSYHGYGFEAIGWASNPFSGVFDGKNHSIIGLYQLVDTTSIHWLGLFGYVDGATIKNINMVDVNISGTSNANIFTGAIAGYIVNSTIENCTVTGTVTGDNYTGGIVGYIDEDSIVTECTNGATVNAVDSNFVSMDTPNTERLFLGGVVGQVEGGIVERCTNNAMVNSMVKGNSESVGYAAGIVGQLLNGSISHCNNNGDITSAIGQNATVAESNANVYAAGIVGYSEIGVVEYCTNTADISSTALHMNAFAGGISAYQANRDAFSGDIFMCHNIGNVSAQAPYSVEVGGISAGSDGNIYSSYNKGVITGTVTSTDSMVFAQVGGIVGVSTGRIYTSYNMGDVEVSAITDADSMTELRIGGVAGRIFVNADVMDCYNAADVTITEQQGSDSSNIYIGGVIGLMEKGSTVNCYNAGIITGGDRPSGGVGLLNDGASTFKNVYTLVDSSRIISVGQPLTVGNYTGYTWRLNTPQLQSIENYIGFNFDNVWTMDGDATYSYPELRVHNVTLDATVKSISVYLVPMKTSYALMDELDVSGGIIEAVYSDNSIVAVNMSAGMISGYDNTTLGTQTLTVDYEGKTATFDIVVKTSSEILYDKLTVLTNSLPQSEILSDAQIEDAKNIIAQAAKLISNSPIEDIRGQEKIIEKIKQLEAFFLKVNPILSVASSLPIVEEGVSPDIALPNIQAEVYGLAFSEKGGGDNGMPSPVFWETVYSLEIIQSVATHQQGVDSIALQIKALATYSFNEAYINNTLLHTPVTLKLYLNNNFNYNHANIEHTTTDPNKPTEKENFKVPVKEDIKGKYIIITVDKFSEFIIRGNNDVNPTASVKLNVITANPSKPVIISLYSSDDLNHFNPEYSSEMLDETFPTPVEPGSYDIVISKEGNLDFTITDVVIGTEQIDFTTHSNSIFNYIYLAAGDINSDGIIDFNDLSIVRNSKNFRNSSTYADNKLCDINGDDSVNSADLLLIMDSYNSDENDYTIAF